MPIFYTVRRLIRPLSERRDVRLIGLAVITLFIGAALFSLTEHISYGLALYWALVTGATVGYGDISPHTTAGRVVAALVIVTTIPLVAAAFAVFAGTAVVNRLRRILGMETHMPAQPYTVVYGAHPIVPRVLAELDRAGDPVVLVAPTKPTGTQDEVVHLAADPCEEGVVARSEPARANRALIACTDDSDTLIVAVAVHSLAPDLEVYALTQSRRVARALHELGITYTLAGDELLGHTIALSLETPEAGGLLLQIVDSESYCLRERPVDDAFVSRPLSEARATAGLLVMGIARNGKVDLGVGSDPVLAAGDKLIVLDALK